MILQLCNITDVKLKPTPQDFQLKQNADGSSKRAPMTSGWVCLNPCVCFSLFTLLYVYILLSTLPLGSWASSQLAPGVGHAHTYPASIPHIAHKRLVTVAVPISTRTSRSSIIAELDRIEHRSFDDETRHIRAQTASLLKRIHTPVIRASRPLPITGYYSHVVDLPIVERITSDNYISHLLEPIRSVPYDVSALSYYPGIETSSRIGRGNLACVSYAGGRAYPRRKHIFSDDNRRIKDEITFRSYYKSLDKPNVDGTKEEVVAS